MYSGKCIPANDVVAAAAPCHGRVHILILILFPIPALALPPLPPRTPNRLFPARQTLAPVSPKTQTRGCMVMSASMWLYRQNRIGSKIIIKFSYTLHLNGTERTKFIKTINIIDFVNDNNRVTCGEFSLTPKKRNS